MKFTLNDTFSRILGCILGAIFVFASWHKIANPAEFAKIIYGYGLFPGEVINLLAIWIPFMEASAGFCLILGMFKRPALLLCNFMLAGFVLVISINLIRGHQFDCGCFSFGHSTSPQAALTLLIRDALMMALSLYLYLIPAHSRSFKPDRR